MALVVIALCVIVAVVALTLYPALNRSSDNLKQASKSAVAVAANLETVFGDLATGFAARYEISVGVVAAYYTITTAA